MQVIKWELCRCIRKNSVSKVDTTLAKYSLILPIAFASVQHHECIIEYICHMCIIHSYDLSYMLKLYNIHVFFNAVRIEFRFGFFNVVIYV
jgi:hypothetical protein